MPWKHLSSWFAQRSSSLQSIGPPLTLVTLASTETDPGAWAFYESSEFETLVEWAKTGQFVLAFAASDRHELTLLCADPVDAVKERINQLPLVEAGLAQADVRAVSSVRITDTPPGVMH